MACKKEPMNLFFLFDLEISFVVWLNCFGFFVFLIGRFPFFFLFFFSLFASYSLSSRFL